MLIIGIMLIMGTTVTMVVLLAHVAIVTMRAIATIITIIAAAVAAIHAVITDVATTDVVITMGAAVAATDVAVEDGRVLVLAVLAFTSSLLSSLSHRWIRPLSMRPNLSFKGEVEYGYNH